ncbi:dTDP-glucose 4,6-dehydratase [subsurface metagenome]|nr:dTDP-glucose 4,6-dehydratase [Clostridia bacterium]
MRLLVTGGAGFIGSNFIRYIIKKYPQYKVINLDKLTYAGNLDNLKDIENNSNYTFVKGDICDRKIVDELSKDVEAIVNFAAQSHVDRSIINASGFIKTNIDGTYNLLEAAKRYNISRFVQISTDECYGSIEKGSFKETNSLRPSSPYAASKAAADMAVHSYRITFNLPTIVARSSNNFGPYQYPEKIIPLFITNALEDKPLPLYGDGMNVRDWLYVIDNCEAIDLILHKGKEGEIYNIGGGKELRNIDLTRMVLKVLGKPESLIQPVKDRPGHDRRYSLDCSKIERELGWTPGFDFEKALQETVKWYVDNQWWWKKLKAKS